MNIGRRIYFEKATGNVITQISERSGSVVPTTVEQDIASYKELNERVRASFDFIDLPYGEFAKDFEECSGFNVNPSTKAVEFSYPDQSAPTEPQPFQEPLTKQIESLRLELTSTQEAVDFLIMGGM